MTDQALSPIRLKSLSLRGFGSYLDETELKIRPLTILCGKNGSGKSTWLKALKFLRDVRVGIHEKQELEEGYFEDRSIEEIVSMERAQFLPLFGEGLLNTTVAARGAVQPSNAQVSLKVDLQRECVLPKIDGSEDESRGEASFENDLIWRGIIPPAIEITLEAFHSLPDPASKDRFRPGIVLRFPNGFSVKILFMIQGLEAGLLSWNAANLALSTDFPDPPLFFAGDEFYKVSEGNLKPLPDSSSKANQARLRIVVGRVKQLLDAIFKGYFYLEALREESVNEEFEDADRRQHAESARAVRCRGQNAAGLHVSCSGRKMFDASSTYSFKEFCDSWLRPLVGVSVLPPNVPCKSPMAGFLADFSTPTTSGGYGYQNAFFKGPNLPASATQLSTGFHQVHPMIVQAALMRKGETLAIENPEVHLHPGLQLEVAEFLIRMALSGRQIVIETHSDLVIRRVLRAILKEEIPQQAVNIYFVSIAQDSEGNPTSKIEKIGFDEKGRIVNWPEGFLDDDVKESRRLLEAMYGPPPTDDDNGEPQL